MYFVSDVKTSVSIDRICYSMGKNSVKQSRFMNCARPNLQECVRTSTRKFVAAVFRSLERKNTVKELFV